MPSLRVRIPETKGKFKELLASAAEEVGTAACGRDQGGLEGSFHSEAKKRGTRKAGRLPSG